MGDTMVGFLILFVGVILLSALFLFEIVRTENKAIKEGYGPAAQIHGGGRATGSIVCVNEDAPTLNRSLSFPYAFQLNASRGDLTGKYTYAANKNRIVETVYNGEVFLSFRNDRVKGRSLMAGLRTFDGVVSKTGAQLRCGYPKSSLLSFLSGPFDYSVNRGKVGFDNTSGTGSISKKSDLRIEGDHIRGRVLHGPQTTWAVEVDVNCRGIPSEQAALAVILACNDILRVHHD